MALYDLMSYSIYFIGHFGDGWVTAASARFVAAVSAETSSAARPTAQIPNNVCGRE